MVCDECGCEIVGATYSTDGVDLCEDCYEEIGSLAETYQHLFEEHDGSELI